MFKYLVIASLMLISTIADCAEIQQIKQPLLSFTHLHFPPYNYADNNHQPKGFAVELLHTMLKDADFRYKKSTIVPLARGLKLARTNKNNIMFSLFKTPQRDNSFNWVGPIGTSNIVILAKKNHKFNAKDPLLAGQRDSGSMETAIKNGFTNIVEVNEYIKGLALINANRADGWIVGLDAAEHLIKDTRLSFEDYYVFKTLSKSDLYYVINKNSDKRIVEFLSQKLKKMKRNGEFKQIASKYGITN